MKARVHQWSAEHWVHPNDLWGYLIIVDPGLSQSAFAPPKDDQGPVPVVCGAEAAVDLGWILLDEGYTPKPVAVA